MSLGLEKKFLVFAMVLSCAAAVFWMAPRAIMDVTAPQEAAAEESPSPLFSGECESATWPNIPAECLTRANADTASIEVAGAQ